MSNNYEWEKANTTMLTVKLNNRTDADIIEFLGTVPNKQGLIKELLKQAAQQAKQKDDP